MNVFGRANKRFISLLLIIHELFSLARVDSTKISKRLKEGPV